MSEDKTEAGFWLPEDNVLRLTALELGALHSVVTAAKLALPGLAAFTVVVRAQDDPMPMIDRLIQKIETAWRKDQQQTITRNIDQLLSVAAKLVDLMSQLHEILADIKKADQP